MSRRFSELTQDWSIDRQDRVDAGVKEILTTMPIRDTLKVPCPGDIYKTPNHFFIMVDFIDDGFVAYVGSYGNVSDWLRLDEFVDLLYDSNCQLVMYAEDTNYSPQNSNEKSAVSFLQTMICTGKV